MVRLSQYLPASTDTEPFDANGSMEVVIYSHQSRTVGVIFDCIVDIIEQQGTIDSLALRSGVVGSFVTENNITALLDLPSILAQANMWATSLTTLFTVLAAIVVVYFVAQKIAIRPIPACADFAARIAAKELSVADIRCCPQTKSEQLFSR